VFSPPSGRITTLEAQQMGGGRVRRLFTAVGSGLSESALRWGVRRGAWVRVERGVYAEGVDPPGALDRERARVLAAGGVASGALAGVLHELDGVRLDGRPLRRRAAVDAVAVGGVPCTDPLQTLMDLSAVVTDEVWEQALECALRRRLVRVVDLDEALPVMGAARTPGTARIRRVLAARPLGAPPTESLLETLMVQLLRSVVGLPAPTRQFEVLDHGVFVARVDLCWPELGLFLELDGQHHKDQPVHDARRETAVVAATGWSPGRFTWHEVTRVPRQTARRVEALARQARARNASPVQRRP
jgi:hypothetical protein